MRRTFVPFKQLLVREKKDRRRTKRPSFRSLSWRFNHENNLICDGAGHPLAVQVFAGHRQESVQAERLLEAVRIPRLRGCPRRRPHYLIADRAYGVDRIRCYLRRRGIKAVIPNKAIPQGRKRRKKGPRPKVDRVLYAKRNIVERLFGWLKHSRRFATRFEKKASHFLAIVKLACIKRLFKSYFSDTT